MIDVKPECPVCGVNIVYYGMDSKLKKEADQAEFEHACMQPRFDRLRSSTIGSPLAIVRIVTCVLPLLATLLPMAKLTISLPYYTENVTVNIIAIINKVFMNLDFDYLFAMMGSSVGKAYVFYLIALLSFVFILLAAVVNIIDLIFAFGKRGLKRNITVASIGLGFTVIGSVGLLVWCNSLSSAFPEVFKGSFVIWGSVGVAIGFIAQIVVNVLFKKLNIRPKYKDVSELLVPYDEREKIRAERRKEQQVKKSSKSDNKKAKKTK